MNQLQKEAVRIAASQHAEYYNYDQREYARAYNSFLRGYQTCASSHQAEIERLKEALRQIQSMKRLPGEVNDNYAFNRCWHIATDSLTPKAG